MARETLNWNGPAVTAKLKAAQIAGVNATMAACVNHAKRNHPWRNRSTTLEGAINVIDFATKLGDGVRGVWGVNDVRYALTLEIGGVIRAKNKKALKFRLPDGSFRTVKKVVIPAFPYLRPAADAIYPSLAGRIAKIYRTGGRAGG